MSAFYMADRVLASEDKMLNKTEEMFALGKVAFYWRRQPLRKQIPNRYYQITTEDMNETQIGWCDGA